MGIYIKVAGVCSLPVFHVPPLLFFPVESRVFCAFDMVYFTIKMRNFKTMFDKPVSACYTVTVM